MNEKCLNQKIEVLDKGFVRLIDTLGSDLTVVNSARISFGKTKEVFEPSDERLINYLAENLHLSPFRHAQLQFHIKAPIFVLRQWMKYRIGSEFNEISGRYVDLNEVDVYYPETFRKQSTDNKQGSEGQIERQEAAEHTYRQLMSASLNAYETLRAQGVCREQARIVLPLGMYSEVYWTVSLQAVCHMINQRTDTHAQWEIQQYAHAVKKVVTELFPVASKYLLE